MILAADVRSRTANKLRDAKIIHLYASTAETMEDIGKRFGISKQRVEMILHRNKQLLVLDQEYEKVKRVNVLRRQLTDANGNERRSEKDVLDVLDAMRKEFVSDGVINAVQNFLQINLPPGITNRLTEKQNPA